MSLRTLVDLVRPGLNRAASHMWTAQPALDGYRAWLRVAHSLTRATAPLLAEAAAECVRRGESALAGYFAEQLGEEYGHDRWVEEDYAAAGGDPVELAAQIPAPAAARLVGAQYYWQRHAHPVALIGHIAVLEWHPPTPALVPELMRRTGLPAHAFRTLARHAELDAGHGARLDQLLHDLSLTETNQRLVRTSALTTAYGLVELMTDIGGAACPGDPDWNSSASISKRCPTNNWPRSTR